jgi:iron complex outermembrane receptor protein
VGYQYQNKNILAKVSGFLRNSSNSIDWVKKDPMMSLVCQNVGDIKQKE